MVLEKPFGRDLASATELNEVLHAAFAEDQIFRIDHYLGKESVEDLLVFRFANTFLEPIWNRRYVRSVQLTMAETIGVEGRGAFYDSVGALRDVVQNHLLQVVTLMAMEPPVGLDADSLHDEKVKVLRSMRAIDVDQDGAGPVPRLPWTSRASTRSRPPRRSWPPGSRSTRGAGPACPGSCEPARRWRGT